MDSAESVNTALWIAEAKALCRLRARQLTDEHAVDLAEDLHRAWPEDSPAVAVSKFFRVVNPNFLRRPGA